MAAERTPQLQHYPERKKNRHVKRTFGTTNIFEKQFRDANSSKKVRVREK